MVKFYRDNFNARFTWGWVDGEFTTDDLPTIENLKGLGLRFDEVKVKTQAVVVDIPVTDKPKRRRRKKKLDTFVEDEIIPALNDAHERGVK